jgi:hypothetical protein
LEKERAGRAQAMKKGKNRVQKCELSLIVSWSTSPSIESPKSLTGAGLSKVPALVALMGEEIEIT